jgi:acetylornithine deacetylase/succinyl-diaminopimelate desuccinylase-like protein
MSEQAIQASVAYASAQREAYLEGFKELLRIPSVSTDPAYRAEVQRAADWLVAEMARIGLDNCQAIPSEGHPVVYGEWLKAGQDRPTVLVYAHYDVQPVDPLELWESPPFEPEIRDGKLYARGSIDDKCGVFVNLKAVESILATSGALPVNVKFFFEGEEESGSPSMEPFVKAHKELLAADLLVISDGGSYEDQPLVFSSLRGLVAGEVTVRGPQRDLHSGSFGGIVHNPAHRVGEIVAALHDDQGRVQIPGFYDDVRPLSEAELTYLKSTEPQLRKELERQSGVRAFWGVPEYSLLERQTAQPTCDVNGLYGGYQGPGTKTVIPAQAGFKVTMRLVADQDPHDIGAKFADFVRGFACDTLEIEVSTRGESWPARLLFDEPPIQAIHRAFEATWGQRALIYRQGGTVPVVGMFKQELGMPITNLGYGVGDNGHSPNEYFTLAHFSLAIDTAIHFYHYLTEVEFPW